MSRSTGHVSQIQGAVVDCRFSVEELQCICAFAGPPVVVYCVQIEECDAILESRPHESLPVAADAEHVVRVVLEVDSLTGCGHFSRLLSSEEWEKIEAAKAPDYSDSASTGSSTSEHASSEHGKEWRFFQRLARRGAV